MVSKNALTFCTRRVALCLKSPNSLDSKIHVIINRQFLSANAGWAIILACTRLPGLAFYIPLLGKYLSSRQTGRGCGSSHNECVHAKSFQLCLTLCNLMNCSPPGFSVHGILQARILEWVAIPYLQGIFLTQDRTCVSSGSCIAGSFFTVEPLGKPYPTMATSLILF